MEDATCNIWDESRNANSLSRWIDSGTARFTGHKGLCAKKQGTKRWNKLRFFNTLMSRQKRA